MRILDPIDNPASSEWILIQHTMRVYKSAMMIVESEDCGLQIVALAALLHDADDDKLFETVDNARDGDYYAEDAKRFSNGDRELEKMYYRVIFKAGVAVEIRE